MERFLKQKKATANKMCFDFRYNFEKSQSKKK